MEKLLNRLVHKGLRGFMDERRQELALEDEVYLKDSADAGELEQRYIELKPSKRSEVID